MGFPILKLYQQIELLVDTSGPMTLTVRTELPGRAMRVVHTQTIDTELTTTGRRTVNVRLPGHSKGHLMELELAGSSVVRLYGARVWAKPIGVEGKTAWRWYDFVIQPTPESWSLAKLPMAPTPEAWALAKLPIAETPEGWSVQKLPIAETPEGWSVQKLPIAESPEAWSAAKLPIEETPERWTVAKLPIAETPAFFSWVSFPMDAVE